MASLPRGSEHPPWKEFLDWMFVDVCPVAGTVAAAGAERSVAVQEGGVPILQRNSRPLNFAALVPDFSVTMTFGT
jgi:hypothetical protein